MTPSDYSTVLAQAEHVSGQGTKKPDKHVQPSTRGGEGDEEQSKREGQGQGDVKGSMWESLCGVVAVMMVLVVVVDDRGQYMF